MEKIEALNPTRVTEPSASCTPECRTSPNRGTKFSAQVYILRSWKEGKKKLCFHPKKNMSQEIWFNNRSSIRLSSNTRSSDSKETDPTASSGSLTPSYQICWEYIYSNRHKVSSRAEMFFGTVLKVAQFQTSWLGGLLFDHLSTETWTAALRRTGEHPHDNSTKAFYQLWHKGGVPENVQASLSKYGEA